MDIFDRNYNLKLDVTCTDFVLPYTNYRKKKIDYTSAELLWSIITLGKAMKFATNLPTEIKEISAFNFNRSLLSSDYYVKEIMYKLFILESSLQIEKKHGHSFLIKSNIFKEFERSEKSNVSFYQGMIFTKLMAEKLFKYPYLVFYDTWMLDKTNSILKKSGELPDLIAFNHNSSAYNKYAVFEAKGRSNTKDNQALNKAVQQVHAISKINNETDILRVASQTYFTRRADIDTLNIILKDPERDDETEKTIDLNTPLLDYYLNIYLIFNSANVNTNNKEIELSLNSKIKIKFPKEIFLHLQKSFSTITNNYSEYFPPVTSHERNIASMDDYISDRMYRYNIEIRKLLSEEEKKLKIMIQEVRPKDKVVEGNHSEFIDGLSIQFSQ